MATATSTIRHNDRNKLRRCGAVADRKQWWGGEWLAVPVGLALLDLVADIPALGHPAEDGLRPHSQSGALNNTASADCDRVVLRRHARACCQATASGLWL